MRWTEQERQTNIMFATHCISVGSDPSMRADPRQARPRLSVGFILARRFTLCAFANFVDVLRLAADEGDRSRPILCDWTVLSDNMNPAASSCGIAVQPHERLGDPRKFDYIVVVGGLIDEIPNLSPEYARYLQRAAASKVPLVGVCNGASILHRAGLMDGYRCCVSRSAEHTSELQSHMRIPYADY